MRLIILIFTTFGLIILISGCAKKNHEENVGQVTEIMSGTFSRSIEVEGESREYLIHIPISYDSIQSVPLILNFHGWTMSASDQMYVSDMRALSDSEQFILVYPQGTKLWGSTHWSVGSWTTGSQANDLDFIDALTDQLANNYNLDEERIYACGYSNGGFFSQELACQLSNKIAAIGTVAANMSIQTVNNCDPTHPVPVITISGTMDNVVQYDGSQPEGTISHNNTLDYWITFNNMDAEPIISDLQDINIPDGSSVTLYQYLNGDNYVEIEHYKIVDGGHDWPGTFGNMDIDANTVIWNFVSQFDIYGKR
jgi:polyhydroxybutyrate depolymerase